MLVLVGVDVHVSLVSSDGTAGVRFIMSSLDILLRTLLTCRSTALALLRQSVLRNLVGTLSLSVLNARCAWAVDDISVHRNFSCDKMTLAVWVLLILSGSSLWVGLLRVRPFLARVRCTRISCCTDLVQGCC